MQVEFPQGAFGTDIHSGSRLDDFQFTIQTAAGDAGFSKAVAVGVGIAEAAAVATIVDVSLDLCGYDRGFEAQGASFVDVAVIVGSSTLSGSGGGLWNSVTIW